MKYSIFSAPGRAERLLEWGGASVRPRAEIFLRGGGSLLGELSSVCVCVCLSTQNTQKSRVFEPGKSLNLTDGAPKLRVWAREKMCELRCSRAHQGQPFFAARACLCGRMTAPCARNFAAILCPKLVQKGDPPWPEATGRAGWE